MNKVDESKLINEAFKPYRFESSFKSKNNIILTERDNLEYQELYNELYENLEFLKL